MRSLCIETLTAVAEVLQRRPFTVDEYHRMGDAGILGCDEQLELIAGQIVVREPIGARHWDRGSASV
jgi:hypothetical protein